MGNDKLNVFVSYSHADDPKWLKRVQVHLKPLARDGRLDLWDDQRIKAGDKWRDEIKQAIECADVAVLLISADFYASDFIAEKELPKLLEAAQGDKGLVVIGVHINYSHFEDDEVLSVYQTINRPNRPLEALENRGEEEKVFQELARRIREIHAGAPPNPL